LVDITAPAANRVTDEFADFYGFARCPFHTKMVWLVAGKVHADGNRSSSAQINLELLPVYFKSQIHQGNPCVFWCCFIRPCNRPNIKRVVKLVESHANRRSPRRMPAPHNTKTISKAEADCMNLDLTGKTAIVCGSTQGIGHASAEEIAALGATVVLMARNVESLKQCVSRLPAASGQNHSWLAADFSDPSQVESAIRGWVAADKIAEILVNNTGGPPAAPAMEATIEEFRIGFNNHLICNHILVQALVPGMKQRGYGRIINIISTSVKTPIAGLGVSNTTRGAVASWAKTMANELAPFGITVNNMLPGMTWTGRLESLINGRAKKAGVPPDVIADKMKSEIPAGRFGDSSELGAVVAFLATPAAAYVTGTNIPVDGGRTPCL
jgi:3-oxoacyl-[acyl-carrier protein] reductase